MGLHSEIGGRGPRGATGATGPIGGSSGAADNALIRANGAGGATIQNSTIIVSDNGEMSGNALVTLSLDHETRTLTLADSGKCILTVPGNGDCVANLPTDAAVNSVSVVYEFAINSTDAITVQAAPGQIIYIGTSASSAGGTAIADATGSYLRLAYLGNLWMGIASGTWVLA